MICVNNQVLAPGLEPISVLKATLPALFDGCPMVIYAEYAEPLTRVFAWLKATGNAIHLQLTETWQREFQILGNCSHPTMTMSASSGYVLSAIKISTHCTQLCATYAAKRKWNDDCEL